MRRTPEQARSFFRIRHTGSRGDGRELYKTPEWLVEGIVDSLIERRPDLKGMTWIDPCAGDGRWGKVISERGIKCLSYDLHPLEDWIEERDFLASDFSGVSNPFFIGNPPFSLLRQFVEKSLEFADCCYFLGGGRIITGTLGERVSLLHRFEGAEGNQKDRRSKAWFMDTNGNEVVVWCCGALFDSKTHKPFHIYAEMKNDSFSTGVHCFCEEDERVVAMGRTEKAK